VQKLLNRSRCRLGVVSPAFSVLDEVKIHLWEGAIMGISGISKALGVFAAVHAAKGIIQSSIAA